jgi:hypothetical protein
LSAAKSSKVYSHFRFIDINISEIILFSNAFKFISRKKSKLFGPQIEAIDVLKIQKSKIFFTKKSNKVDM